jgi:hypothetical protein
MGPVGQYHRFRISGLILIRARSTRGMPVGLHGLPMAIILLFAKPGRFARRDKEHHAKHLALGCHGRIV